MDIANWNNWERVIQGEPGYQRKADGLSTGSTSERLDVRSHKVTEFQIC